MALLTEFIFPRTLFSMHWIFFSFFISALSMYNHSYLEAQAGSPSPGFTQYLCLPSKSDLPLHIPTHNFQRAGTGLHEATTLSSSYLVIWVCSFSFICLIVYCRDRYWQEDKGSSHLLTHFLNDCSPGFGLNQEPGTRSVSTTRCLPQYSIH